MTSGRNESDAESSRAPLRKRFGGIDIPASLGGMLTALGFLVLVGAFTGGIAAGFGYRLEPLDLTGDPTDVVILGAVGALLVLLASFLVGGWATGRIARYSGGINGLVAALWAMLVLAALAALGAWVGAEFDALGQAGIAEWLPGLAGAAATGLGIAVAAASLIVMLLGGFLGGKAGGIYHRRADAALVELVATAAPAEDVEAGRVEDVEAPQAEDVEAPQAEDVEAGRVEDVASPTEEEGEDETTGTEDGSVEERT